MGINGEFLESKSSENVFIATQIVYGYKFARELEPKEKSTLIQLILRSTLFNKSNKGKLATLLRSFEQVGFDQQQTYGVMINLFVKGLSVDGVVQTYPVFFANKALWDRIKAQHGSMPTNVNDITIKKAENEVEKFQQRAQKTMRRATIRMAEKGTGGVRGELGGLKTRNSRYNNFER